MMFESHFKLTLWEWRTLRMRLKNPLFFQITPSIQWITLFKIRILKLFLWLLHSKTSVEEQKKPHLVQPAFLQLTRNNNVSYLNNNSNYISTSTTLELWHKVLPLHSLSFDLSLSLSSSQCGSLFGGQAPDVAQLHDGHLAAPALWGKDKSPHIHPESCLLLCSREV